MKRDIRQVYRIAKKHKMTPRERRRFGAYIHQQKRQGRRGSGPNGDFTWEELDQLADEFQGKREP